jgi:spore coat protein SA
MKIALVCSDRLPIPPIKGGAIQLLIHEIAPILARQHEVTVFSVSDPSLPVSETINRVNYCRYSNEGYFQEISNRLTEERFDFIHLYNRPQWVSEIKKRAPHSRVTVSLHNLILGHSVKGLNALACIKHVDHVVTVSRFVANDLIQHYPSLQAKVTPLYTGVNSADFVTHDSSVGQNLRKQLKQKLGIPPHYKVLLFVGRLVPYKGCHIVIQSIKTILKKCPHTALVIVGGKWYADNTISPYILQLKKLASTIPKNGIYFTQFIPLEEIPAYYTMSDILVCASQWKEPLARIHYEAMAAGIPIITTNRGGNAEVISHGRNGYVIRDYKNPNAFAKSCITLLKNEQLRARMGRLNRSLAEEQYNFERYADRLSQLFRSIS